MKETKRKTKSNERGWGIVETIVVLVIVGTLYITLGPRVREAMATNASNALAEEFSSALEVETTLSAKGGSLTHGVLIDVTDSTGASVLKDYGLQVAPSSAYVAVTQSVPFNPASGALADYTLDYGVNTITCNSSESTMSKVCRGINVVEGSSSAFGTPILVTGLSAQGGVGIAPLFSNANKGVQEDFIKSPRGLNLATFTDNINMKDPSNFLKGMFGNNTTYNPYVAATGTDLGTNVNIFPIELVICDTGAIKESNSGSTFKTLTNTTKGMLYQVGSVYSKEQFIAYAKGAGKDMFAGATTAPTDAQIADMYDSFTEVIRPGALVFIPHRDKDLVKASSADLQYGFYCG